MLPVRWSVSPMCVFFLLPLTLSAQQSAAKPVQVASSAKPAAGAAKPAAGAAAQTAEQQAAMLKTTLEKLRVSSAKFVSAEANVERLQFTYVIHSNEPAQTGRIYILRDKNHKVQFGIRMNPPDVRIVEYKDGVLRDDQPLAKKCLSITKKGVDSYVTLGFGGGPDELQADWTVTDLGPETMAGVKVEKLSLVPRDVHVKANYAKVEIWVDLERDVTLKQVFYATNNDTNTATYTDIHYNTQVKTKPYEIQDKPCQ